MRELLNGNKSRTHTFYISNGSKSAKWIGSPGGNQDKQVEEVLDFCRKQRGNVIKIGIIDGFPWAIKNTNDAIINFKAAVQVQES